MFQEVRDLDRCNKCKKEKCNKCNTLTSTQSIIERQKRDLIKRTK